MQSRSAPCACCCGCLLSATRIRCHGDQPSDRGHPASPLAGPGVHAGDRGGALVGGTDRPGAVRCPVWTLTRRPPVSRSCAPRGKRHRRGRGDRRRSASPTRSPRASAAASCSSRDSRPRRLTRSTVGRQLLPRRTRSTSWRTVSRFRSTRPGRSGSNFRVRLNERCHFESPHRIVWCSRCRRDGRGTRRFAHWYSVTLAVARS